MSDPNDLRGVAMEMTQVAGSCKGEVDCPKVFVTDRGTIAVQGDLVDLVTTPLGEAIVEIPVDVFVEAARAVR